MFVHLKVVLFVHKRHVCDLGYPLTVKLMLFTKTCHCFECKWRFLTFHNCACQRRGQVGARGRQPPNDEKVGVRETFTSAIKSMHRKLAFK